MATIIKPGGFRSDHGEVRPAAFNFDDITAGAEDYLTQVKRHAAQIVAQAKEEAEQLKRKAENEGRQSAAVRVEQEFRAAREPQLTSLMASLRDLVTQLNLSRQQWLARWEQEAVHLSVAIAERIVRRELTKHPTLSGDWVREALKMAGGCGRIRVMMNPADLTLLGADVKVLAQSLGVVGQCDIAADDQLAPGSCKLITEFGEIDNGIATQLKRIEEELTSGA